MRLPSASLFLALTVFGEFTGYNCWEKWRRIYGDSGDCRYSLNVTDDGPVTLDVPVTFRASLACARAGEQYLYTFEDDAEPRHAVHVVGNGSTSVTFVFDSDRYVPATYIMRVSAYLLPYEVRVATTRLNFTITEYIPGYITMDEAFMENDATYVATGEPINITMHLYYPLWLTDKAEFSYSWVIDKSQDSTSTPSKIHTFNHPGEHRITAVAVARIPVYDENATETNYNKYKWGYFYRDVVAKVPFHSIDLTGNTYLQHGQLLNMDVSCNGSGPFEYCWKVLKPSGNSTNLTCDEPTIGSACFFPIVFYFHDSGDYTVAVHINNYVSSLQRNFNVHVYDVSLRPQLSTVLIPLVCSVLVIVIIAVAFVLHIRLRQNYDIETADFDFMLTDSNSSTNMETSWEQMFRSLVQMFCPQSLLKHCYVVNQNNIKTTDVSAYGTVSPRGSVDMNR